MTNSRIQRQLDRARTLGGKITKKILSLCTMGTLSGEDPDIRKFSEGILDARFEIASSIRGQKFVFPDLEQLFEAWPVATNVHVDALRIAVDENLEK